MTEHVRSSGLERTLSDGGASVVLEESTTLGRWRQYFTCFVFAMLCMSTGLNQAWSSPMIQILETDASPVGKMDNSQIGTLQSVPQFAAIAGVAVVVITLIKFGTKASGWVQGFVSLIGWVLMIFASNRTLLYIGRFCTSTTNIGADVVSSFYLSEIADDSRRGALIAFAMFAIAVGSLSGTALGVICENYKLFNSICIIPCLIFLLLCHWIPDSPSHFIRVGKTEEACKSYIWFRGVSMESAQRYVRRMQSFKRTKFRPKVVFEEKSNRRALLIMIFLVSFSNLCGTSVISSYSSKIFENAKISMKPNQSALLLASVGFIAGLTGALLIERAGRRFLVIAAFTAMALGLYAVTAFFMMKDGKLIHNKPPEWLIFAGLGCFSSGYTIGVGSVSQIMGAELVPAGIKGVLWMFAGIGGLISSLVTVQLYTLITNHTAYYVNFLQEAVFATAGIIIAWFLILETKGKSLAQITAELKGERYDPDSEVA